MSSTTTNASCRVQFTMLATLGTLLVIRQCIGVVAARSSSGGSIGSASSGNSVSSDLNSISTLVQQQQLATKTMLENALQKMTRLNDIPPAAHNSAADHQVPCTCGVFLSGQFDKAAGTQPRGNAALMHEQDVLLPCNAQGNKQCTNRCLEMIVKHLPNSPNIICGTIDRDCHRERAYLFIQNCNSTWINTKLSAGREYCCKAGTSMPCPLTL